MLLDNKTILITGGTGTFGSAFVTYLLNNTSVKKIIIYSRDEFKQFNQKKELTEEYPNLVNKVRFFIGDVRDLERLRLAFNDVDYVIHAAAMKQVPACEYNPFEAIKTNILGAQNIITTALEKSVKKVVALSTDKAVNPINLYGGTKLVSDKLFISANAYSGQEGTRFSVVRYGNVSGSRGSVIPFFQSLIDSGAKELPITDVNMTRFWITIEEGIQLVLKALETSVGGETYISKIPSFRVVDLAQAMAPHLKHKIVGIREGEKIHELMISRDDSRHTYEFEKHYIIFPHFDWWSNSRVDLSKGSKVSDGFKYTSGNNTHFLSVDKLIQRVRESNH